MEDESTERERLIAEIRALVADRPVFVRICGGDAQDPFEGMDLPTLRVFLSDLHRAAGTEAAHSPTITPRG